MSFTSLLPLAATLAPVALRAAEKVAETFSFRELMFDAEAPSDSGDAAAHDSSVAGLGGGPLSVGSWREAAASLIAGFQQLLNPGLAALGVDTSSPLELRTDGSGGIEVDPTHPDKMRIAGFIQNNPSITAAFEDLSAKLSSLKRSVDQQSFFDLQAVSPQLAHSQHQHLFDRSHHSTTPLDRPFVLRMEGSDATFKWDGA